MLKKVLFFLSFFIPFCLNAQTDSSAVTIKKDTLIMINEIVVLDTVHLYPPIEFKNDQERKKFDTITWRIRKVWPYVIQTQRIYEQNLEETKGFTKKREVRKYNRKKENLFMDQYKDELKQLSRKSGLVMVKLIHRQTNRTVFELIKDQKSGWSAFWWQAKAGLFELDLKAKLDIVNNRDDYLIERYVREGISNGTLQMY